MYDFNWYNILLQLSLLRKIFYFFIFFKELQGIRLWIVAQRGLITLLRTLHMWLQNIDVRVIKLITINISLLEFYEQRSYYKLVVVKARIINYLFTRTAQRMELWKQMYNRGTKRFRLSYFTYKHPIFQRPLCNKQNS